MDERDLLNFNYPLQPQSHIQFEKDIREQLKAAAYNLSVHKDIERYSDRHLSDASKQDIRNMINIEILSPELQRIFGMHPGQDADTVLNDVEDEDNENDHVLGQSGENESLEGGDDYAQNYYDEDELVDEDHKNEGVM